MLRMVLKNGDQLKLGEDIIIKSMNEQRISLAIDAPKELKILRIRENDIAENEKINLNER